MHDHFGFYIYWGITSWLPIVYPMITLYLVTHRVEWPLWYSILLIIGGVYSVYVNYDADRQRQIVRETNGECKIWGRKPKTILAKYTTGDGKTRTNLLLVDGYWGIARHFHYIPELALTLLWSLPAGFEHFVPYFYFVYLFILLFHRLCRDEERCMKKYGQYWEQYKKAVAYKFIPYIY